MKKTILTLIMMVIMAFGSAQVDPLDTINVGTGPNTGTGEPVYTAFIKINHIARRADSNANKVDSMAQTAGDTLTLNQVMQDVDTVDINNDGFFALPQHSSDPTVTRAGFMYWNTTSSQIRYWNGSTWTTL